MRSGTPMHPGAAAVSFYRNFMRRGSRSAS